jgi:hypothetical protein
MSQNLRGSEVEEDLEATHLQLFLLKSRNQRPSEGEPKAIII